MTHATYDTWKTTDPQDATVDWTEAPTSPERPTTMADLVNPKPLEEEAWMHETWTPAEEREALPGLAALDGPGPALCGRCGDPEGACLCVPCALCGTPTPPSTWAQLRDSSLPRLCGPEVRR